MISISSNDYKEEEQKIQEEYKKSYWPSMQA